MASNGTVQAKTWHPNGLAAVANLPWSARALAVGITFSVGLGVGDAAPDDHFLAGKSAAPGDGGVISGGAA